MSRNGNIYEYPGSNVLLDDYVVGYFTAALKAGVWAVRQHLNNDPYRKILGHEIPVDMEAPMEGQEYPYIHVMYQNNGFEPVSLEESNLATYATDEGVKNDEFSIYKFNGQYRLNIYATTVLERERIADCCIGAIGIDNNFKKLLVSNPYVALAPNMHTLSSPTANESWGTPWDQDTMTAFRQLSFDVVGEFCYRHGTSAEFMTRIELTMLHDGEDPVNATLQPKEHKG